MNNYGQRSCLFCGKMFTAVKLQQFFCSQDCGRKRKNERKRASRKRCEDRIKAEIEELKARVRELEGECERLSANLQDALKKNQIVSKTSVDSSTWPYCQRMRLRAKNLPCGEREECHGCENAK